MGADTEGRWQEEDPLFPSSVRGGERLLVRNAYCHPRSNAFRKLLKLARVVARDGGRYKEAMEGWVGDRPPTQ